MNDIMWYNDTVKNFLHKAWHYVRWPLGVVVVLYVGLVVYRVPAMFEKDKTASSVAKIHAQKITLADVLGTALPPIPNAQENNATVAGIDKNNNGIRDDVELAIFNLYPNSARIRAAELQYAMTLQLMITDVFNTETWIAAAKETSRGYACISQSYPRNDLKTYIQITDTRTKEVETLVYNTQQRKAAQAQVDTFTTSYSLPNTDLCNIDSSTLPN
ncbi:MAG: hypothetical protein Q7S26_00570 [bacterium]|nr:hypothetical protein [bacterium]